MIVKKRMPHGAIPFSRITDRNVRDVLMKINENMNSIKDQLEQVQDVIVKKGS